MGISDFRLRRRLLVGLLVTATTSAQLIPSCLAGSTPARASNREVASTRISQIKATAFSGGVLIEWRTAIEIDNLGFNIVRECDGQQEKINAGLIAGAALKLRPGSLGESSFSYAWFDRSGSADCTYHLTNLDLSGRSSLSVAVTPELSLHSPAGQLSDLFSRQTASAATGMSEREWSGASGSKSQVRSARMNTTESLADNWAIANQPALKIGVRSAGWYHITRDEIAAAGFDTTQNAQNLRMFVNATEIAIRVSRESGALTSADFIEFWGEGLDIASSDTQVYWLLNGTSPGKRIASVGELQVDTEPAVRPVVPIVAPPGNSTDVSRTWFSGIRSWLSPDSPGIGETQRNSQSPVKLPANDHAADGEPNYSVLNDPPPSKASRNASTAQSLSVPKPASPSHSDTVVALSTPKPVGTLTSPGAASVRRSSVKRQTRHRRRIHKSSRLNSVRNASRSWRAHHNHAVADTSEPVPAFICNVERKDRTLFFSSALNGPTENFFGEVLAGDPPPLTLTLHNVDSSSSQSAQLQVALRGVNSDFHQVNVSVNGMPLGNLQFLFQDPASKSFSIPISALVEGSNSVKFVPAGIGNDVSLVDYVRIVYPRRFVAVNNSLQFSLKSTLSPRVDGFTSPGIRVFDITDTASVRELRPIIETSSAGFAATIPAGSGGKARRIVAQTDSQLSHPASLTLNQPSTLNQSANGADLLIISYRDFMPALTPLVTQRHDRDGYNVKVVDVEDVYDEFGFGVHGPQAIKDFLSRALSSWSVPPRYVLLVGDASFDPRNYLGNGLWDFVPSMPVDTNYMEANSDDSLGDFNNDGVPELAIGRLPARSVAQANLIVTKLINFNPANIPQGALMVADNPVGYDFEAFNEHLIDLLPASMNVLRIYRNSNPTPHDAIINTINQGVALVNYSGHGSINIWAGPIFSADDAFALNNTNKLPFVTVMDCLNGYFTDPLVEGIGEAFLKAPNGGAIASFASSGETGATPQHEMGERMFQLIYATPSIPIGDASRQAKSATTDLDVRRTWILFGDPTMKIR
jgi:hypothetical protein